LKAHVNNYVKPAADEEALVAEVIRATKGLRFGHVVLTVHDSRVVQIDRTEKIRLDTLMQHDKGSGI
jgi:hypothetical protein